MTGETVSSRATRGLSSGSWRALLCALAIAAASALNLAAPAPARAATGGPPACATGDVVTDRAGYDDWQMTMLDRMYRLPVSYAPPDLVASGVPGGGRVRSFIVPDLKAMARAARLAGAGLRVESAYRSYSDQIWTFGHWANVMPGNTALLSSARRGHSEHQLGTVLDFATLKGPDPWVGGTDWATTRAGAWMKAHAWEYGFIQSYPKGKSPSVTCYVYEPWHFRYFGREVAKAIHDSRLTAREWLWEQNRQSPSGVTAVRADGSATVSWRVPVGDGGSPITGYVASSVPDGRSCTTTGSLSCEITGLTNGSPYVFRVRALHGTAQSPPSVGSAAVVPRGGSTFFALIPNRVVNGYVARSGIPFSLPITGAAPDDQRRNVPAGATAVTGVLSVSGATSAGSVTLDTSATSTAAPTLSFGVDEARSTGITVPLNRDGSLSVRFDGSKTSGVVCVTFDVSGYFLDGLEGATYVPLTPNRLADSTRNVSLGRLVAGAPATFQATSRTLRDDATNVPANAIAVTGTLAVARQTAAGHLAIGPDAQSSPGGAGLYFPKGDARATDLTVGLGTGGSLSVTFFSPVAGATADVTFDVTGYFLPGSAGATYVPVAPRTVVHSRVKLPLAATRRAASYQLTGADQTAAGNDKLPLGATAVTGWFAVSGAPSGRWLTLSRVPGGRSPVAGLSFPIGGTRSLGVTVPLNPSGRLEVGYGGGRRGTANLVFEITGYFVA